MAEQDVQQAFDEIRRLFRETDERFAKERQEREAQLDKERQVREARLDKERQEREVQFAKERQERIEGFKELRELFKATDRRFKETDQKIKELADLFTSKWGQLIEALVKPGSVRIFQERGIGITGSHPRIEKQRNGTQMEVDLLLTNDDAVVVIEVKTTLKVDDVRDFLDDLKQFEEFFPEYKGKQIYAAVAGVSVNEAADRCAYQRGLFVIGLGDDRMVRILNDSKFKPKDFAQRN